MINSYTTDGQIDEETMQGMNAKVDNENMMVEIVAKEFLQESGLVEGIGATLNDEGKNEH